MKGLTSKKLTMATLTATLTLATLTTHAATYYVSPAGNDDGGTTWEKAFTQIQTAVAKTDATEIIVTNGTYAAISRTDNAALTIRSVNGAKYTIIDGGNTNRCATLGSATTHTATVLTGFTLTNGNASHANVAVQRNYGGGAYGGTLNNCILTGNSAYRGAGTSASTLNNCMITGNTASNAGGGVAGGTLNNCTVVGNKAGTSSSSGGGVYNSGRRDNCIIWGNFLSDGTTTNNYYLGDFRNSCSTFPTLANGNINSTRFSWTPRTAIFGCTPIRRALTRGAFLIQTASLTSTATRAFRAARWTWARMNPWRP